MAVVENVAKILINNLNYASFSTAVIDTTAKGLHLIFNCGFLPALKFACIDFLVAVPFLLLKIYLYFLKRSFLFRL